MNGFAEDQNVLFELKKHIDLMSRQLDFLIKNNKHLTNLDIDVLMSQTHNIYELVCSAPCTTQPTTEKVDDHLAEKVAEPKSIEQPKQQVTKNKVVAVEPMVKEKEEEQEKIIIVEPIVEKDIVETKPIEETIVEEPAPLVIEESAPEIIDPEPIKAQSTTEETITIADKMAQQEDDSLAARLQRKPIKSLKNAIGINEKFLFVNELFGGSMEKYNKSINILNEVSTLSGANVCLNELKVELQWNSTSEAYNKLQDLVVRRFETK